MTILITGATGLVGRPLVRALVDAGAPVRAVTREPDTTQLPAEVDRVTPDQLAEHPRTALTGVTAVFLNGRAAGDGADELVAAARDAGATRIVALSADNVDDPAAAQPSRCRGDRNAEAEQAATRSRVDWIVLRCTNFAANSRGLLAPQVRSGVVQMVYPVAGWAPLHELDVAEMAAAALTRADLIGRTLSLTGPAWLTQEEQVRVVAQTLGIPLRSELTDPAVGAEALRVQGFPDGFIDALHALLAGSRVRPDSLPTDIPDILGHSARDFASWVRDHRLEFVS